MADQAKVQEVFSDEVFVKNLLALETPGEVQAALRNKGLDFTVEDIVKIKDAVAKKQNAGEELSDEDLEGVAGGSVGEIVDGVIVFAGNMISFLGNEISTRKW
ncbi:MAG: Nif11-like leader peptide family natural product precursor [Firmicutes bacterium]|nr:Nif11-like leader peptide family natural product precursor [Bacillota bacterium]